MAQRTTDEDELQLPLVVGAVRAASVVLDAQDRARVQSPQLAPRDGEQDVPQAAGPPTEPTEPIDPPTPMPEPAVPRAEEEGPVEPTQVLPEPPRVGGPSAADSAGSAVAVENADTALMPAPVAAELGPAPGPAAPPPGPTVEATVCVHGHPNPPGSTRCRECGSRITDSAPRAVAQPVLAVLRGSDGGQVALDRTVLVGRAPAGRAGVVARLLTVPSPGHDISRTHLQVAPEGWRILVTDLHSTNGTVLVAPGSRQRRLLPPGEPVPVELGSVLELADGVSVLVDLPR